MPWQRLAAASFVGFVLAMCRLPVINAVRYTGHEEIFQGRQDQEEQPPREKTLVEMQAVPNVPQTAMEVDMARTVFPGALVPVARDAGGVWRRVGSVDDESYNMDSGNGSNVLYLQGDPNLDIWEANPEFEKTAAKKGVAATVADIIVDIGGGTGATVGGTGDIMLDRDLLRRMRYQDKAVMLLLLLAYTGSLAFSASLAYRQATNDSPVTYYADPRYHSNAVESDDLEAFLDAFNQPPKDVQLQVLGLVPLPPLPEYVQDAAVEWLGSRYRVAFSFALDLSSWVVRNGDEAEARRAPIEARRYSEEGPAAATGAVVSNAAPDISGDIEASVGISAPDLQKLQHFLAYDQNDLAVINVQKEVVWQEWEELATNIKHQIRQSGFGGIISVRRTEEESMTVYKNRPWANFMHSRTTKVLCALSLLGWFIYQPYIWIRYRTTTIVSRYRVDVSVGQYWPLIADKIGPDGFDAQ